MPELPEVETTLRGVAPHIQGKSVRDVKVRQAKLRWQIHPRLPEILAGQTVRSCSRRAKYLLIQFETGVLLIHLGMSGSLRIFRRDVPAAGKHDHADIEFADGSVLRYHDPRRFGAVVWFEGAAEHHPLLQKLGPEPLENGFDGGYLFDALQKQSRPIKTALMDNALVVGVGNIYANESLFQAGILPERPAKSLSADECRLLAECVKRILTRAIETGGSTLRDFVDSEGKSGYFQQEYCVYGRNGEHCRHCGGTVEKSIIGQRGTFFCRRCQK